jgi:hypothetical protein
MAEEDAWLIRYRKRQEQQKQYGEQLVQYAVPALRFLGVSYVAYRFDGEGDSGSVVETEFEDAPEAGLPEGLERFLESACYCALPGGWEINAGSSGHWFVDPEDGSTDLEIEWRDEDEDPEENEYE